MRGKSFAILASAVTMKAGDDDETKLDTHASKFTEATASSSCT